MNELISYRSYRFPPEIISYAVWIYYCIYYRFALSLCGVEDLLAERGVILAALSS